jgi:hypothetical protein
MISVRWKDLRNPVYYVGDIMHESAKVRMKTEMEGISEGKCMGLAKKRTTIWIER